MRNAILVACLLSLPAVAGERYLGTISATTAKNNTDTASPFEIPASAKLSVQCSAAAHILVCRNASSCTATTTNGIKVAADALFMTSSPASSDGKGYVSVVGTADCRIFERAGNER